MLPKTLANFLTYQQLTCRNFIANHSMKKTIYCLLIMTMSCKNNDDSQDDASKTTPPPDSIGFSIINVYPHDTSSFTQGLVVYKGILYEGTGEYGTSKLLKTDFKTGRIEKSLPWILCFLGKVLRF